MIGEEVLLSRLEDALSHSAADGTEILAERLHTGVSRFANSMIHQTTVLDTVNIWVRASVGKSVGGASGDSLEPGELRRLVEAATSVARNGQPNPDFVSFAEPEPVTPVDGYDEATAEMGAEERARAIGAILECVGAEGWTAAGTYLTEGRERGVVSSLGVRAYAPSTMAFLRALPNSGRGTGYADTLSHRAADLDPLDVARRAMQKCALNHDQQTVPPGEYETIFEDLCTAEALLYLARDGFSGRAVEEGRSFISARLGERVTGENVTIWDDGADPRGLAVAADYEGIPKRKVMLIDRGIAVGAAYDSYTAHKAGQRSTGAAGSPDVAYYGAVPTNLFMAAGLPDSGAGEATIDEMIRSTKRGLLLTRFHYTHGPDPKRVVMTGTTRDGTFLIENGEIVCAVKNLRLTQSVPELFEGIELFGQPRLCRDWWCSNGMGNLSYVCPPLKLRRAVFSSGTLF